MEGGQVRGQRPACSPGVSHLEGAQPLDSGCSCLGTGTGQWPWNVLTSRSAVTRSGFVVSVENRTRGQASTWQVGTAQALVSSGCRTSPSGQVVGQQTLISQTGALSWACRWPSPSCPHGHPAVCVCVLVSSSHRDSVTGEGRHHVEQGPPWGHHLGYPCKDSISKIVTF